MDRGGLAALFLVAGLLRPSTLNPLNLIWLRFGLLLHKVNPIVIHCCSTARATMRMRRDLCGSNGSQTRTALDIDSSRTVADNERPVLEHDPKMGIGFRRSAQRNHDPIQSDRILIEGKMIRV
jgi:hypothetical protein